MLICCKVWWTFCTNLLWSNLLASAECMSFQNALLCRCTVVTYLGVDPIPYTAIGLRILTDCRGRMPPTVPARALLCGGADVLACKIRFSPEIDTTRNGWCAWARCGRGCHDAVRARRGLCFKEVPVAISIWIVDSNRQARNMFIVTTFIREYLWGPYVVPLGFALPHTSEGVLNTNHPPSKKNREVW